MKSYKITENHMKSCDVLFKYQKIIGNHIKLKEIIENHRKSYEMFESCVEIIEKQMNS